jgi:hypothetical protein
MPLARSAHRALPDEGVVAFCALHDREIYRSQRGGTRLARYSLLVSLPLWNEHMTTDANNVVTTPPSLRQCPRRVTLLRRRRCVSRPTRLSVGEGRSRSPALLGAPLPAAISHNVSGPTYFIEVGPPEHCPYFAANCVSRYDQ